MAVAAFYRFVPLDPLEPLQQELLAFCQDLDLRGTILLAPEGINATVAGSPRAVQALLRELRSRDEFKDLAAKISHSDRQAFHRMKVRLKKEIVTMGVPGIDPNREVGTYLDAEEWNDLIQQPDVTLVDTRNRYEVQLGTFEGAIDPETDSFRDFPEWVAQNLDPDRNPRVAMFCTGGIRCEKATALLKNRGFKEVYHLNGGILQYLEDTPRDKSRWNGECFVFDNRVTVDHELNPGHHEICFNCRMPLSEDDLNSPRYEKHVSCPHCYAGVTESRRASLKERARQVALAEARGQQHIGQVFEQGEHES